MESTFKDIDESGLQAVALQLVKYTEKYPVVAFYGAMGAGKTTLIRALCAALNVVDPVSSPTFSIVNEYITLDGQSIFHFDFYRIKKQEEALDFGYEEYLYSGNICLMEWPDLMEGMLPDEMLRVEIEGTGQTRTIKIITT